MSCGGCGLPHWFKFKLSIFGMLLSFLLVLAVLIPPFSSLSIILPLPLALAVFFMIPSLVLYYNVKEKFWAEVFEKHKSKEKPWLGNL